MYKVSLVVETRVREEQVGSREVFKCSSGNTSFLECVALNTRHKLLFLSLFLSLSPKNCRLFQHKEEGET